jgi:hypothetical protein
MAPTADETARSNAPSHIRAGVRTETEATDMRDLRLVGISEDRRHVVLRAVDTDEEFRLAADESLRTALRGDRARLGQLESHMDSALRPRDIQARIRAGATPEEVADLAKVPVERIMGYAVPVLAEREHIVGRARTASVRRKHTEGPTRTLGDTVTAQLRALGEDPETARWESWRRDDGRWVVTVAPGGAQDIAHYAYDTAGRYVMAEDDAARRLIADEPATEDPSTMAVATAVQAAPSGPVPVDPPDWSPQDADRSAPEPVAEHEPDEEAPIGAVTRLRRRRSLHQVPDPLPLDETEVDAEGTSPPTEEPPARAPEPRRRRDRRRASVPSWDEIMFGGKGE